MKPDQQTFTATPYLILGLGILAVSTAAIFIRFAQQSSSSLTIAAFRLSFAVILLTPATLSRNWHSFATIQKRHLWLMIFSGVLLAFHFASWITSLRFTSVASSVVLVTTTPLWVALMAPFFLRERITPQIRWGLLTALIGGVVVGLSDSCRMTVTGLSCLNIGSFWGRSDIWGNLLAVSGAVLAAGYLMVGRSVRTEIPLAVYIYLVYGVAAAVLVAIAVLSGQKMIGLPWIDYIWFLALAVIPQLIGHTSFNWSLKYLPAAYVSIALLGEPIGSTLLAYFILKEAPTGLKLAGAGLILLGIVIASLDQRGGVEKIVED